MSVDIRLAERDGDCAHADRTFVAELGRRCVISSVSSLRPAGENSVREAFDRLYAYVQAQPHVTLVAWRGNVRAGFLLLLSELPDEVTLLPQGFIAYMAVEPTLQGQGIGAALLAAAETEAKRRHLPYMSLMVTEENEPACRLYARAGYRTERRLLCKPL